MATRGKQPELPGLDADEEPGVPTGPTPLQWGQLLLGAARRRKLLAAFVLIAGTALSVAYLAWKPRMYRVEAKILAQRQQALPSAARPVYEDVPTRSAWEMVHRRENLLALVRETNLLAQTSAPPAPKPGWLEWLASLGRDRPSLVAADPLQVLVAVLDRDLLVGVEDGTITIKLDWVDPQQAYDLVRGALQNFLEARYLQEVTAIDEIMSVLQGRAAALRDELDAATQEARRRALHSPRPVAPRVRQASEDLVRLHSLLEAKQRAIRDVEEFRRRRLADVQAQLDQARNTLSDQHPTVIGLRKDIDALTRESPQIETLREDERRVRREYNERLSREGLPATAAPVVTAPSPPDLAPEPEQDPRVRQAQLQYEQMMIRVNSAKAELDAARAAFKYRYNVIWPPQFPRKPVSPNPGKILGAGMLASLVLALLAAAAPDLWSGRIVERWQVERSLNLPVLGEFGQRR